MRNGLVSVLMAGVMGAVTAGGTARGEEVAARRVGDFLGSMGACVHVQHRQDAAKLVEGLKYTGLRNVRDGADGNFDMRGLLLLHEKAGVGVCFGPGSGAKEASLAKTIGACKELAAAGALVAVEGPNEPNNFGGVTYQGENSDKLKSWVPVAKYQRDLYAAVKGDAVLKGYPVLGPSEVGAQDDNCGLQFLKVPAGAGTLMPDGTVYADYLNDHNYVCGHIKGQIDNQASLAAAVNPKAAIDHLYGNHGNTWRKKFAGYTEEELAGMPRATTETGWKTDGTEAGDAVQGKVFMNVYLAQFKAGWRWTFVYEFVDDADGAFGFYKSDLVTPRVAATYVHHLTGVLADDGKGKAAAGKLGYSLGKVPGTVHEMLLEKSDGTFELMVWGERVKGSDEVKVAFGERHGVVRVYDPTIGATPTQAVENTGAVSLTVSDHVLIVEIPR